MLNKEELYEMVAEQPTALLTVAATMRNVYEKLNSASAIAEERQDALRDAVDTLDAACARELPVRSMLISEDISPRGFMALMINVLIRVLPTYAEIPINLAPHGLYGDLKNYGLIALNVSDEAGRGVPQDTHPALFNNSAQALARVFGVPPLSVKVGCAALSLRLCKELGTSAERALTLAERILCQDEWGRTCTPEEIELNLERAARYEDLIAEESMECYRWRIDTMAELIAGNLRYGLLENGQYASLAAMLAVREAAASDREGIFSSLSEMVCRYGGYLDDPDLLRDALIWSDAHVDEALGSQAGYEGHSVEDDHAIQALQAVLDHVHDDRDLLSAVKAMNSNNEYRYRLWEGTVRVVAAQDDERLPARGVASGVYQQVRDERVRV